MPEKPEVRRFADALNQALGGKPIVSLKARTKTAIHLWIDRAGGEASKLLRSLRNKTALRVVFFRPPGDTAR
jgi:formamidopyrimidine-DNA glycosylase